jgi:predicted FMN-binding regulatory protein PaiB
MYTLKHFEINDQEELQAVIVGVAITVTDIQGKFKLSPNTVSYGRSDKTPSSLM